MSDWGVDAIRRNFRRVVQSEGFGVCSGLLVQMLRAVCELCHEFMTVPRQIFCIAERGTYVKWDSPVGAKTCESSRRGQVAQTARGSRGLLIDRGLYSQCCDACKTNCYCKQLQALQL